MVQHASQTPGSVAVTHQLMGEVLSLKDARFVDGTKVMAIVKKLQIRDVEAKIYFLRELHGIARRLPLKLYRDDQNRNQFITAVQDALDQAIDEEEDS